ncbi:MAG: hypothetical protein WBV81_03420, partial [Ignavibacteriaceae bacterium]
MNQKNSKKFKINYKIIISSCLLVGTLDILAAIIDSSIRYGITPLELLQYIASGVFGAKALSGGLTMGIAGLVLHYFIASCWVLLFFYLFLKLKFLHSYKIFGGLLYGIFIWLVMNLIVVPLSNTHKMVFNLDHA